MTYFPSLLTWRDETGEAPITTATQWLERRAATTRLLVDLLGGIPVPPGPGGGRHVRQVALVDGVDCWRVVYDGEAGEEIPAYLLVPHGVATPAPAVVAVHGTSPYGKDTVVQATQPRHYARHLLERGLIVLAPDVLAMGERIYAGRRYVDTTPFYARHPNWSMYGKIVFDLRRAVDYLYSLDIVDKQRVGMMGHSLGGHSSFLAAGLDPRIAACGASCGVYPWVKPKLAFEWSRPRPERWIYIPRLRDYLLTQKPPPVDMHEIIALIAPRAFYNQSADEQIPEMEAMLADVQERVAEVYRVHGAEDRVRFEFRYGPHDFPEPAKAAMCDWMAEQLRRGSPGAVPLATPAG
jgi:dienelactone hydrolase